MKMIRRSKVQIAPLSLDAQEPRRFNTRPFEVTTSKFAQVAQLVEQGIENPRVGGSIPSLGTTQASVFRGFFRSVWFAPSASPDDCAGI